jgi:aminoglycoside/choline kinase family phosphotransferase
VFAERYRRRLAQLGDENLCTNVEALAADAHIAVEWGHFLDGTYGLCTRSGLPEDIAAKEAAIVLIRELSSQGGAQELGDEQRKRLAAAVDLLDAASAPFAPHEVARSSRRRYVDEIRAAWLR